MRHPRMEKRKIHQTHFPVNKKELKRGKQSTAFVWVALGNGKYKLVRQDERAD